MQFPQTLSTPTFFHQCSSPSNYNYQQCQPFFFSVPNPVVTPLQTNSPCPDVDSSNKLSSYFQTPEVTSTPMEMDDDYNQNQIFDMNDLDDIDDDIDDDYEEDEEDTDDSMSGQDHLASKLLETMQNLKRQSEETNKMLKNIVEMNSPAPPK